MSRFEFLRRISATLAAVSIINFKVGVILDIEMKICVESSGDLICYYKN